MYKSLIYSINRYTNKLKDKNLETIANQESLIHLVNTVPVWLVYSVCVLYCSLKVSPVPGFTAVRNLYMIFCNYKLVYFFAKSFLQLIVNYKKHCITESSVNYIQSLKLNLTIIRCWWFYIVFTVLSFLGKPLINPKQIFLIITMIFFYYYFY